jgi:hypothetical protein
MDHTIEELILAMSMCQEQPLSINFEVRHYVDKGLLAGVIEYATDECNTIILSKKGQRIALGLESFKTIWNDYLLDTRS